MNVKANVFSYATLLLIFSIESSAPAYAADAAIASDNDSLSGDHLRLRTNANGFLSLADTSAAARCAPAGSRAAVSAETADEVFLRFLSVTDEDDTLLTADDKAALAACPKANRVNGFTQYKIPKASLRAYDFKRSGITFGGLVVPFKYRLGSSKELVSSSTVAPFIGFRTAWLQGFGLTFTPVVAAGLSLVPVADATTNSTSTKSAYTVAVGLRLTSSKNENFSAGLIYGRDYLSRVDREADPSVRKPWASFYLGYAM